MPGLALAAVVAVVVVLLGGCGAGAGSAVPGSPAASPSTSATPAPTPTSSPVSGPRPIPEREETVTGVEIPAIGVAADELETLRLLDDGELSAPEDPDLAGFYDGGPLPGDRGPAVIAGHVDSDSGPAVFYDLARLSPGDEIVVGLSDGTEVTFAVDQLITAPKAEFPTREVYGPVPDAQLRLITCGGPYDTVAGSYVDNTVVFATMVDQR